MVPRPGALDHDQGLGGGEGAIGDLEFEFALGEGLNSVDRLADERSRSRCSFSLKMRPSTLSWQR